MTSGQSRVMFWAIHVLGGGAVLGSYAWGLGGHPELADALWGGVPVPLRPIYSVNMILATVGYLAVVWRLATVSTTEAATLGGRGYGTLLAITAVILACSVPWMPLTVVAAESGSNALLPLIWAALAGTGIASVALVAALATLRPRRARWRHRLAVAGSVFFAFQTAVLDGIIWPLYFDAEAVEASAPE